MMNMNLQPSFRPSFPMAPLTARFPAAYPMSSFSSISSLPYGSSNVLPPLSNMRYHHLKQSTNNPTRRFVHHSVDGSQRVSRTKMYNDSLSTSTRRSSKRKSISDFEQLSRSSTARLSKANSWHSMGNVRSANFSVAYAKEMRLTPKSRRKHSPKRKKSPLKGQLSSSPKRRPSFRTPRKPPALPLPERGVVRISTLDELPLQINPRCKQKASLNNNDRSSTKGSVTTNSIKQRTKSTERLRRRNSIQSRNMSSINDDDDDEGARMDFDDQSTTSSSASHSSLSSRQRRLNRSLRNDPLISAAMENFRQLRRTRSRSTINSPQRRNLSRDSVCSTSTYHSSRSPSIARSHSQSSFTSVERSEIRQVIKSLKTKKTPAAVADKVVIPPAPPHQPTPISSAPSSREASVTYSRPSIPVVRQRKSSVTEELDREFNKLRARDPDQELTYVTPSSICKRKKPPIEKALPAIPPLPTLKELLNQVKLRPVDKSLIRNNQSEEKPSIENYADPLPVVAVPRSSPIPTYESLPEPEEIKHEYAKPSKRSVGQTVPAVCHFQPTRLSMNFSQSKPTARSLSRLNWFQNTFANPVPTTFQPNRTLSSSYQSTATSINENIYTPDVPALTTDHHDEDSLQKHLENQTILTDYYYSEYDPKSIQTNTKSSSIFHHFKRKHEKILKIHRTQSRCSLM